MASSMVSRGSRRIFWVGFGTVFTFFSACESHTTLRRIEPYCERSFAHIRNKFWLRSRILLDEIFEA